MTSNGIFSIFYNFGKGDSSLNKPLSFACTAKGQGTHFLQNIVFPQAFTFYIQFSIIEIRIFVHLTNMTCPRPSLEKIAKSFQICLISGSYYTCKFNFVNNCHLKKKLLAASVSFWRPLKSRAAKFPYKFRILFSCQVYGKTLNSHYQFTEASINLSS